MAQNTGGMSGAAGKVEYSLDATTWVDMSGSANTVSVTGGERMTGDAFTGGEDTAIIAKGKRQPYVIEMAGVYSETTGTPQFFEALMTVYRSGAGVAFRWSPTAYSAVNQKRFTTATNASGSTAAAVATIVNLTYPSVDFGSGEFILSTLTLRAGDILTEDHA